MLTTVEPRRKATTQTSRSPNAAPPRAERPGRESSSERKSAARIAKRVLDIVVAGTALVVLSPLMLIIALLIRWKMGSPVLFRQTRIGQHERPFEIIKFRTLINETERDGRPLSHGDRLTELGWFLRKHSLDELPQLWNILRGDLSLVGPRPLLPEYLGHYTERERLRHTVPAGVTGLAQVMGRNHLNWDQKLELDVTYAEKWSLRLDFYIIGQTIRQIIRPHGVARDPVGSLEDRGKVPEAPLDAACQADDSGTSRTVEDDRERSTRPPLIGA